MVVQVTKRTAPGGGNFSVSSSALGLNGFRVAHKADYSDPLAVPGDS